MTYFSLEVGLRAIQSWKDPIDVARKLSAETNGERWNFNRYNGKIEARFDVGEETVQNLKALAERMESEKRIESYEAGEWDEPGFVQSAHWIATGCAVKFREEAESNRELEKAMSRELVVSLLGQNRMHQVHSFLYCLACSLLQGLGFDFDVIWDYRRQSLVDFERVKEIGKSCVTESMRKEAGEIDEGNLPSFVERFVHLFLNCISRQQMVFQRGGEKIQVNFEAQVRNRFINSVLWSNLAGTLT